MRRLISSFVLAAFVICRMALSQAPAPSVFTGVSGTPLVNAKVIKFDGENFIVEHDDGISTIPWARAPESVRSNYTRGSAAGVATAPKEPKTNSSSKSGPEQKFARFNFAITPPVGWETKEAPPGPMPLHLLVLSPDNSRTLTITADDRHPYGDSFDETKIADFERGVQSRGDKPLWVKRVQMDGKLAYERRATVVANGVTKQMLTISIISGGMLYTLIAIRNDSGEPGEDPESQKFFSSFRFLTAPVPASR